MDFFRSTFYQKYTPLTSAQIQEKLKPSPSAAGASPLSPALSGKTLKIVLDQGPVLEYKFITGDKLTFSESGCKAVTVPYSAKNHGDYPFYSPDTGYCARLRHCL